MLTCIFISTEVPRKWSFPTRVAGMFKQRHVFSCFWPVSNCQDTCWDWPVARVNWKEKDLDRGIYLPRHHCPFEGCEWSGKDSGDQLKHIMSEHWTEDMQEAVRLLGAVEREAAVYSVLNAGISMVCQENTGPEKLEALLWGTVWQGAPGANLFFLRLRASTFARRKKAENSLAASGLRRWSGNAEVFKFERRRSRGYLRGASLPRPVWCKRGRISGSEQEPLEGRAGAVGVHWDHKF